MPDRLQYEVVDVFTDRPYGGNPLAVVLDADGLTPAAMQSVAREFNLSETVFVCRPTRSDAAYAVRIFTPTTEIPFAGHPTIGAAATLVRLDRVPAGRVVQECGRGPVPVDVSGGGDGASLEVTGADLGRELDPAPLLAAAGLTAADLTGPPPREAGCGMTFPFLPVRPDAVSRAANRPQPGVSHLAVFAWDGDTRTAHLRAFLPGFGVAEDAASGSAVLGLGVWLVGAGLLPGDGESAYHVRQGAELCRPSRLDGTVTARGGAVQRVRLGGGVRAIASGTIRVPPDGQSTGPD
ncbi:PhzF family phenazine biosynthesis protein [Micromonospora sp. NBC_00858]|uniref:PhzF family phenazine biosynthesis protein n=1 Tax=Micromonospora sp. NBC_00858 TaxID=2975979 RepID=UPI003863CEFC|nr:PhzF family phenazine biosynthesis protein [Micromonospora sp. NBC_00858]